MGARGLLSPRRPALSSGRAAGQRHLNPDAPSSATSSRRYPAPSHQRRPVPCARRPREAEPRRLGTKPRIGDPPPARRPQARSMCPRGLERTPYGHPASVRNAANPDRSISAIGASSVGATRGENVWPRTRRREHFLARRRRDTPIIVAAIATLLRRAPESYSPLYTGMIGAGALIATSEPHPRCYLHLSWSGGGSDRPDRLDPRIEATFLDTGGALRRDHQVVWYAPLIPLRSTQ